MVNIRDWLGCQNPSYQAMENRRDQKHNNEFDESLQTSKEVDKLQGLETKSDKKSHWGRRVYRYGEAYTMHPSGLRLGFRIKGEPMKQGALKAWIQGR